MSRPMPPGARPVDDDARYDRTTIRYHWLTAFLVGALWLIGQTRGYVPRGALHTDYLSLHMTLGVLLGVVLILRIAWRSSAGRRLPPAGSALMHWLARSVHGVLYLLIVATIGLGIVMACQRGENVFNLFTLPSFASGNVGLRRLLTGWHSWAADIVMIVAGLHAAAGIGHHVLMRDGVLRRMVPFLRS